MPIYEYQGQQYDIATDDHAVAKAKILKHLGSNGGVDVLDEVGRTAKTAASNLAKLAVTSPNLLAGGLSHLVGASDLGDDFFKRMEQTNEMLDTKEKPQTLAGKVAAGVAPTAAALLAGGAAIPAILPMGFGEQASGLVKQGVGAGTANLVSGIDTALNLAGGLVPGGRVVQGLVNPVVGAGSDIVNQQILKRSGYTDVAKNFDPLDPERRLTDVVTGAMFPPQHKKEKELPKGSGDKVKGLADELKTATETGFKPKFAPLPDEPVSPMERMARDLGADPTPPEPNAMTNMADTLTNSPHPSTWLDAQRQAAAQEALNARQAQLEYEVRRQASLDFNAAERQRQLAAPIPERPFGKHFAPDSEQLNLWDQPEMVQHGQKYMANSGDWRIDENGMPVRVDLALDAQHAQNMLQRDLWVDETPEFAKIQETQKVDENGNWLPPQETRSVAESLDHLDWAHKRGALKSSKLGRELEDTGEIAGAQLAADVANPADRTGNANVSQGYDHMPGMTELNAALSGKSPFMGKGRKQAGALDPEVFKEGGRALSRALSRLTDQPWVKAAFPADQYMTNSDGTPMILLHGTTKTIVGKLKTSDEGLHAGFTTPSHMFVSRNGKVNNQAVFQSSRTKNNASIHPVTVKRGNYPLIQADPGNWEPRFIFKDIDRPSLMEPANKQIMETIKAGLMQNGYTESHAIGLMRNLAIGSIKDNPTQKMNALLERAGIDGFFYKNTGESSRGVALLSSAGRTDINKRLASIDKNMKHGTSFVTYNKDNLVSLHGEGKENLHGALKEIPEFKDKEGNWQPATPFFKNPNFVPKSQQGKVLFPFGKKKEMEQIKKIPGLKENLKAWRPDESTNEEFLAEHKNTADVSQNILQKGMNQFTKGGFYMALKTGNPLIKRVVEKYLNADNFAKSETQRLIHDDLAPRLRNLPEQDLIEVWGAVHVASTEALKASAEGKTPKELTIDMLQRHGFNNKQIEAIQSLQNLLKVSYDKMAESVTAAGMKPPSPLVAYVAGMSKGDFRTLLYKSDGSGNPILDKEGLPTVAGIIGATTKIGLQKKLQKFLAENPDYVAGEERYFGGPNKLGMDNSYLEMLNFLSANDPNFAKFVEHANDTFTGETFDFMNAKKHTLQKKGVIGMEGNKPWENAKTNAIEGLQAQLHYAETMIRWAEMSKAAQDVKPLLAKDSGLDMPNAKAYLQDYITNALGKNPSEVGHAVDNLTAAFGKSTGLGTSPLTKTATAAKTVTNGLLLGFFNPLFMSANLIQPFKTAPEMMALLRSKGVEDAGIGYTAMAEGFQTILREANGPENLNQLEKAALEFAKRNHVYSSDLFESGNQVRKTPEYYWQKGTQFGAAQIEQMTRKMMFFTYVNLLYKNGLAIEDGLFKTAQRFTDAQLNNYSHTEAPMAYNSFGSAGRLAYNLMSYKHNELSRLSLLFRDMPKNKTTEAFALNVMSQVAFGGLMGTILYQEADWLVRKISETFFDKPVSITKMLLENPEVSKYIPFGMANAIGLDMTSRMGLGTVAPDLSQGITSLFPGSGKLVESGKALYQAAKEPNEYNIKNAIRETTPLSVTGGMDRGWFSKQDAQGNELAVNRNKAQASVTRNETDKLWKTIGGTGTNEAAQKRLLYENQQADMFYKEKRSAVVDNMAREFFTDGKVSQKSIDKFIKFQGDPQNLITSINEIAMEQKIPQNKLILFRNAASASLASQHSAARRMGRE